MDTIALTPAVLRALGEGCSRLDDGDLEDGAAADQVRQLLAYIGYKHEAYDFHKPDHERLFYLLTAQFGSDGRIPGATIEERNWALDVARNKPLWAHATLRRAGFKL